MDFGMMTTFNEKTNTINSHGSGFTKQERSEPDPPPPDDQQQQQQQLFLRTSKSSRTDYFDQPNNNKSMPPMRSDSLLSVSAPDSTTVSNHMLSFSSSSSSSASSSSSSSSTINAIKDGNQTSIFSFYQPSPAYIRNTGYGSGGLQTGMQMPVSRYKGPFTPSQWMELEHQALIYKHFVANVPVPSHLLNPLRKSLNTFLFPGSSSSTSYAPNSYGWGTFHLGFSGNTDPEPGRCRRTDGKKWRCSRDAVPDQKYCERHINRGRHRSRKPVEGQNGHAVSGPTAPKVGPLVSSSSVPLSATRPSATAAIGNQFKTLHHHNAAIASSTETNPINRIQESQAFAIPKQNNPVEETSDSLMYPTNYSSFLDQGGPNPNPNANPLPHFVDQWSKVQSGRTTWPEEPKPDWTQLSMSIPMASSDFSSSSNSPAQEKLAVAPLGLSNEFDLDPTHKHSSNWIPISWGNSMGGPLGEVLNRTSSSNGVRSKNASSSSGSEMWDHVNYQMGSSPTGVLQKTTFVSLSNSSSGSSPKGGSGGGGGGGGGGSGGGLCDELLLSTLAS